MVIAHANSGWDFSLAGCAETRQDLAKPGCPALVVVMLKTSGGSRTHGSDELIGDQRIFDSVMPAWRLTLGMFVGKRSSGPR